MPKQINSTATVSDLDGDITYNVGDIIFASSGADKCKHLFYAQIIKFTPTKITVKRLAMHVINRSKYTTVYGGTGIEYSYLHKKDKFEDGARNINIKKERYNRYDGQVLKDDCKII